MILRSIIHTINNSREEEEQQEMSDCGLHDLIEQKEKKITYVTYPNYHDETYADWSLE